MKTRAVINWFSEKMEEKLIANDHKGGWEKCDIKYLSTRLAREMVELKDSLKIRDRENIIKECADIANYAMMIADKYGENYGK